MFGVLFSFLLLLLQILLLLRVFFDKKIWCATRFSIVLPSIIIRGSPKIS